jgi:ABC-type Co2+ transport system permease subunit
MLNLNLDASEVVTRAIKYLVEGLAVAVAAFYIPKKQMNLEEIAMIAVTAAASFAVLDLLAPSVGENARHGAGFGIGASLVGAPALPGVPPLN